ncbi:PAS domain-containing sensor histidine kinase [Flavobacteriaceae bacterium KMM 6897]|nr:PAS domain-containing sensor histidine kinase [Flavobacteriaceae bacterium KMM 6897]
MANKNYSDKELRQRAETKLGKLIHSGKELSLEEAKKIMHELEVHQIELELQNQELRDTQFRLEEIRDQYTDLFDFAPIGYLLLDKKAVITNINLTACDLFGLDRAVLKGKHLSAFMSSAQSTILVLQLNEAFENGHLPPFELKIRRWNQGTFTALIQGSITTSSDNENPICRVTLQDITEQNEAEKLLQQHEALQKEKEKIQRYLDLAPVVFLLIDAEHMVQMINQKGCKLLGLPRLDILGKNWFENFINTPEKQSKSTNNQHFQNNMLLLKPYFESEVKCKDGETRLMGWTNIALLENNGNQIGTLTSGEDITERKKTEANQERYTEVLKGMVEERTQELMDALVSEKHINEMKSSFVSIASHELRTPITIVLSSIILIEKYGAAGDFEKQQKHIERIKSSLTQFTAILDDFLSLDKLERGVIRVKKDNFDLPNMISKTIGELEGILKEDQKISHIHVGPNEFSQDEKLFRNILINLLSNAIKYSEKDIEVTSSIDKKTMSLEVKDYGIGIPEDDREFLFKRFFRAKNVEDYPGTGLGLSIVERYLDLLEGSIEFISQENSGSTFKVKLH